MPSLAVYERQKSHEIRQLPVNHRCADKMKVVRHDAVREEPDRDALKRTDNQIAKQFVVTVLMEQSLAPDRAVQ